MVVAEVVRPGSLRRFVLQRDEDLSGVSGTGVVAHGVEFPDGRVALRWKSPFGSTSALDSIKAVEAVHGHEGSTHVWWLDPGLDDVLAGDAGEDPGSEAQKVDGIPATDSLDGPVVAPWLIEQARDWSIHNFGDTVECPDVIALGGLTEELGELARALFKRHQGIRGTYEQWTTEAEKETGDVLLKLLDVAWRAGIDFNAAVLERWEVIRHRDWRADPQGHGIPKGVEMPKVVVLCGSTRFESEFRQVAANFTMDGMVVLMPNVFNTHGANAKTAEKEALDELHKRKIDMADSVFVVNPGGYIGDSTRSEIAYAILHSKPVRGLERLPDEVMHATIPGTR